MFKELFPSSNTADNTHKFPSKGSASSQRISSLNSKHICLHITCNATHIADMLESIGVLQKGNHLFSLLEGSLSSRAALLISRPHEINSVSNCEHTFKCVEQKHICILASLVKDISSCSLQSKSFSRLVDFQNSQHPWVEYHHPCIAVIKCRILCLCRFLGNWLILESSGVTKN